MAIIGVDCDEVLSETVDELLKREFFKKKNIIKEDITSYNFWEVEKIGITQEEGVNLFFSFFATDDMLKIKPVKGAKEKLTELKNAGHKLIVVTARAEQFKERTIKRININYPGLFSDYLFMNQFKENEVPKSKLCKDFGIELLIDDSINNLNDINKDGIPGILLDKPWNKSAKESKLLKRAMSREDVDVSIFLKKE